MTGGRRLAALGLSLCLVLGLVPWAGAAEPETASPKADYDTVLSPGYPLSRLSSRSGRVGYWGEDYLVQPEGPLDPAMVTHAAQVMESVYETYLAGTGAKCYLAVIPGKDCLVRESLDGEALTDLLTAQAPHLTPIPLSDLLTLDDYYRTDNHWRQEKILDVAQRLAAGMDTDLPEPDYTPVTLSGVLTGDFFGLYPPWPREDLTYLTSSTLDHAVATSYDLSGRATLLPVYSPSAGRSDDPYALFLGGARGLVTLRNPDPATGRHLLLFRDSFGSSLAPLLLAGYDTITLVDLRYLPSPALGRFLSPNEDTDVLFLYSTLLLNRSTALR
jgi:hypothetical protein